MIMKSNYLNRKTKMYNILSNYTFDEYEPNKHKRCKDKQTGEFYSYTELGKIIKLSPTQTKKVVYKFIESNNDITKFAEHGNIHSRGKQKYGHELDTMLIQYYHEYCDRMSQQNGPEAPFTLKLFVQFCREEKHLEKVSQTTIYNRLIANNIRTDFAYKKLNK